MENVLIITQKLITYYKKCTKSSLENMRTLFPRISRITLLLVVAYDEDWTVFYSLAVCIVCDFTIDHR